MKNIMFLGYTIPVNVVEMDFRKEKQQDDKRINTYVEYDPKNDTLCVDKHSPAGYTKYVAVYEAMVHGDYGFLLKKTPYPGEPIKAADWLIIAAMPKNDRRQYAMDRVDYYSYMLDNHLCGKNRRAYIGAIKTLRGVIARNAI